MFDHELAHERSLKLYETAMPFLAHSSRYVKQSIEAGEYALALDEIAATYIKDAIPMPPDLFTLFETMAADMELETDPEYAAVAKLRARGPLPAGSQDQPDRP